MSDWMILYYGTVLDDGEPLSSERVIDAAGPAATFQLHIGGAGHGGAHSRSGRRTRRP